MVYARDRGVTVFCINIKSNFYTLMEGSDGNKIGT